MRFGARRARTWRGASIGGDAFLIFAICCAYTLTILVLSSFPDTVIGKGVLNWIHASSRLTERVLSGFWVPCEDDEAACRNLHIHRHLVLACLLVAAASFLKSRPLWSVWAVAIRRALGSGDEELESPPPARFGYRQMLAGIAALVFFLLWDDYRFGSSGSLLYSERWTFLRVPVLAAVAYSFACYAAAFRRSLGMDESGQR